MSIAWSPFSLVQACRLHTIQAVCVSLCLSVCVCVSVGVRVGVRVRVHVPFDRQGREVKLSSITGMSAAEYVCKADQSQPWLRLFKAAPTRAMFLTLLALPRDDGSVAVGRFRCSTMASPIFSLRMAPALTRNVRGGSPMSLGHAIPRPFHASKALNAVEQGCAMNMEI